MNFERSGGSKGGLQGLQFLLWMKVFNKLLFRGKRYQTWFTPCLNFSGSTPGETSPLYTYFSDKKKTLMLIIIDTRFELFNKYLAYRPLMIFILIFTSGSYFTLLRWELGYACIRKIKVGSYNEMYSFDHRSLFLTLFFLHMRRAYISIRVGCIVNRGGLKFYELVFQFHCIFISRKDMFKSNLNFLGFIFKKQTLKYCRRVENVSK